MMYLHMGNPLVDSVENGVGGGVLHKKKMERFNTKYSNKIQQNLRYLNFKIPE